MKRLLPQIRREVVEPLFRRVGTALAAGLIGAGPQVPLMTDIQIAIGAALLVSADLILSHMSRNNA
jgi:hypothetical protein